MNILFNYLNIDLIMKLSTDELLIAQNTILNRFAWICTDQPTKT